MAALDDDPEAERAVRDRPPAAYWLLPALVALLRILPYEASLRFEPPPGGAVLQLGYMPKDTLAYLSFIRQVAEDGSFLLVNQFTTEPQTPRFVLLLHWLLGVVCRATGLAPSQVLELSRVPLIFVFFAVLWSFLRPIFPERRVRVLCCVLVGLAGGVDWLVEPLLRFAPPGVAWEFSMSTQDVFGWSTFEGMFNPLWIAGLTLLLVALGPILDPRGPRRVRDDVAIFGAIVLLAATHPYSAVVVAGVALSLPVVELLLGAGFDVRRHARIWLALAPALACVALLSWWQSRDPVYRLASDNFFGPEDMSIFFYPFTFGATLVLAILGARIWVEERRPYRFALTAWLASVVWLHSSPLVNGYHFLLYVHLPLCVFAAPALARLWEPARLVGPARLAGAAALAFVLFAAPFAVTWRAIGDVARHNTFPADYGDVVLDLQRRPAGNALVPPRLGNILPAFTPHHVWVGHWFLSPDVTQRTERYQAWTSDPARADELRALLAEQAIDYLVVPTERAEAVAQSLGGAVAERSAYGSVELLVLRPADAPAGAPAREMLGDARATRAN